MSRRVGDAADGEGRFLKIGEVAARVGVPAHVLRYWEAEVPELAPLKTRGAHRMYRPADVAVCLRLRDLVKDQGLTLAAARLRLRGASEPSAPVGSVENRVAAEAAPPRPDAAARADAAASRRTLLEARSTLAGLLARLEADAAAAPSPGRGAEGASARPPPRVRALVRPA